MRYGNVGANEKDHFSEWDKKTELVPGYRIRVNEAVCRHHRIHGSPQYRQQRLIQPLREEFPVPGRGKHFPVLRIPDIPQLA